MNQATLNRLIASLERTVPGWSALALDKRLARLADRVRFRNEGQLRHALETLCERHNRRADPVIGGLSPNQVADLMCGDWSGDTSGVQLNAALSPAVVAETLIIRRALVFLRELAPVGTAATTKGHLNRKFVAALLPVFALPEQELKDLHIFHLVINESDAYPVLELRVLLELAQLIHRGDQRFEVTPLGRRLMAPAGLPELYALLFRTMFRHFNLDCRDRLAMGPDFQASLAYSFYRLADGPDTWHSLTTDYEHLVFPEVLKGLPTIPDICLGRDLLEHRCLEPLEMFGLVELERAPLDDTSPRYLKVVAWRRTELLRPFVTFRWTTPVRGALPPGGQRPAGPTPAPSARPPE